jgi:hypothetical protein
MSVTFLARARESPWQGCSAEQRGEKGDAFPELAEKQSNAASTVKPVYGEPRELCWWFDVPPAREHLDMDQGLRQLTPEAVELTAIIGQSRLFEPFLLLPASGLKHKPKKAQAARPSVHRPGHPFALPTLPVSSAATASPPVLDRMATMSS